jgi:phosphohistidine phosphatase
VKELLLLRHAKSDWNAEFGRDHDRPLAPRGRAAAKLIGRFLKQVNCVPDLVITSSASRAQTTAKLAASAGGWRNRLIVADELYDTSTTVVVHLISAQAPEVERLMLVGHNPTWEETAGLLSGGGKIRLPTAAVACIRIPILTWSEVAARHGTLQWLVTPKLLKRAGIR